MFPADAGGFFLLSAGAIETSDIWTSSDPVFNPGIAGQSRHQTAL
jgi:hypothetical protein